MPAPKIATIEVGERLKRIQHRGKFANRESTEFIALERDIRKLLQTEPADGYGALGSLYSLAGDVDALRENFAKAFRLSKLPILVCNYAIALANLGYFSEAIREIALCERPENGQLEKAILLNIEAARFRRATELILRWDELHQDGPWAANNFAEVVAVLDQAGIADNDLMPLMDILGATLRDFGLIFLHEPRIEIYGDNGSRNISIRYLIMASPKVASDVESAFVDRLFDSNINTYSDVLTIGFSAAEEFAKQVA